MSKHPVWPETSIDPRHAGLDDGEPIEYGGVVPGNDEHGLGGQTQHPLLSREIRPGVERLRDREVRTRRRPFSAIS